MTLTPIILYPGGKSPRARDLPPVPHITWVGTPNRYPGWDGHAPIAIVIHTMAGFLAGTDSTFNDPGQPLEERASAHFGVALDGTVHQYVDLADRAWANGRLEPGNTWFGVTNPDPNNFTVSIETEDRNDNSTPVSDQLYQSVAGLVGLILQAHPSIAFLTSHHVISPVTRQLCCGARWTAPTPGGGGSRIERLARAARLDLRI
jgi:N-acetyl-anhydromuramyl-L-alanine amidase AmpD